MFNQDLPIQTTAWWSRRQTKDMIEEPMFQHKGVTELVTETSETQRILLDANFVISLAEKLQEALHEIRQLRTELSQRPLVSTINLHDLGTNTLTVKLPIPAVLHETDEESLARWPETRAYGIGSTLAEAISVLKQNIADLFFDLKSRDPESLGEIAEYTLRILETYVQIVQ